MELARFIFIACLKVLALLFLSLLAAKAVGALRGASTPDRRHVLIQWGLYGLVLALVTLGAMTVGYDVAAEVYVRAGNRAREGRDLVRAYMNTRQAVELRPTNLSYWQALSATKFAMQQYASGAADASAIQALAGGKLSEPDGYQLGVSYYLLGEYTQVHPLTQSLIRDNRFYAAPYVLEGYALLAENRWGEATKVFQEVLRMYPTQQSAVEGLAHAQYLGGNRLASISVLDQTAKYKFSPEVRQRFEALKGLYGLE